MITEEQKLEFNNMDKELLNINLRDACFHGHLDIVKYLLTSPDLKKHANIHENNDWPLQRACRYGNLEVVKYLLTSPDLTEYANIHEDNDLAFKDACYKKYLEIVKYLIFDYKIDQTVSIRGFLILENRKEILDMFDKRDLQDKLSKELNNNNIIEKRTKI